MNEVAMEGPNYNNCDNWETQFAQLKIGDPNHTIIIIGGTKVQLSLIKLLENPCNTLKNIIWDKIRKK